MSDGIELQGYVRVERYALARLPNEHEYVTPRGGTITIPMWAVTPAVDTDFRFGVAWRPWNRLLRRGYGLHDLRYVRTLGRKVGESRYPNLLTNQGLEGVAKMLIDSSAAYDTGIKRAEIGDGDGTAITPTVDDTALVNYVARFATDAPTQSAAVIEVVTPVTVTGGGDIYIRELGIYIADNTATENAGDLLCHVAMDEDNSGGGADDIDLTYEFPIARKTAA